MRENKIYLQHILEAIKKINRYTKGLSFDKFLENEEKKDAVVRNLEIIGEAASKISPALRKKLPGIQWRDIVDMRNRLIHEYFGVDYEIVWNVVKVELPRLKEQLKKAVKL
ncbi:MAG: DUF86 domain-containing protein [Candidatus Omnitrophota bacterium]